MTRTVFNENNTGHITKTYPMFFGDSLGLMDTVNVVNKEIESLKEKLDERAIHAIKTVIILEHARCNKITDTKILKSLDNLNFLNRDLNK